MEGSGLRATVRRSMSVYDLAPGKFTRYINDSCPVLSNTMRGFHSYMHHRLLMSIFHDTIFPAFIQPSYQNNLVKLLETSMHLGLRK